MSGVFLSSDEGNTWTCMNTGWEQVNENDPFMSVYSLTVMGGNIFAGTGGNGMFISTDTGANWSDSMFPGMDEATVNILVASGSNLFAGMSGYYGSSAYGIYLSTNNGVNWSNVSTAALSSSTISSLAISDGFLFVGTNGSGVWRRPLSEMISSVNETLIVSRISPTLPKLSQPVLSTTTIDFSLPASGRVSLIVYNALGEQIATLANGEYAAGKHSASFDASGLQNGMYFYLFAAGESVRRGRWRWCGSLNRD